jgi:hypothetical protein
MRASSARQLIRRYDRPHPGYFVPIADHRRMNPKLRRQLRHGPLPRQRCHRHSRAEFRAVLLSLYAHVSRPLDRSALSLSCCPKIRSRRNDRCQLYRLNQSTRLEDEIQINRLQQLTRLACKAHTMFLRRCYPPTASAGTQIEQHGSS